MARTIPTPEIDRMHEVKKQSQAAGEFLEWLQNEKEWELASHHEHDESCYSGEGNEQRRVCGLRQGELLAVNYSIERLLAEYFDINLQTVDSEKAGNSGVSTTSWPESCLIIPRMKILLIGLAFGVGTYLSLHWMWALAGN